MTMISDPTVYAITAGVYAVALAVLGGWLWQNPDQRHPYCLPVLFVVGFGAVTTGLQALGVGSIAVAGGSINVASVSNDMVGYPALYVVSALLAGASRRSIALVTAIPFLQVLSFNVASVTGGTLALVAALLVVVGHAVLLSLYRGRIWRTAADCADGRRLLHWKSRNLLLFMTGMLIVYALLSLFGVFGTFVSTTVSAYMGVLIRVGFAGFLFVNLDAIVGDGADGDAASDPLRELGSTVPGVGSGAD
ncbi:hypothetical protein [Halorarum halobium]|uniref:hypothetical protein n=1 Tax=Halorarum halobium TaxID=3075121 RepID=UPI0028ACEC8C|nr:hypothetical protein [Halobaculum sp. XH14]